MKRGFEPGVEVQAKLPRNIRTILTPAVPERAKIVRYDGEGFYIVSTETRFALIVHEDDIELLPATTTLDSEVKALESNLKPSGRRWGESDEELRVRLNADAPVTRQATGTTITEGPWVGTVFPWDGKPPEVR